MEEKSFIKTLFDLSFSSFITTIIIKGLFILGIIGSAIWALAIMIGLASQGGAMVLLGLILGPIVFALGVILSRVYCEMIIVFFRMAEYLGELVSQGKSR